MFSFSFINKFNKVLFENIYYFKLTINENK